ncbi:DUF262 domain-containing protein [Chachezhania antarctica]|uniref:DUF262 domain-containing protein n=1 Tax=Chachezhania antarctica TaxID=2340860 RepID=UPI000EB20625|nr:DUF262 domain-containing protein [Chachezhania antarctica]|tara:strand:- start:10682 stop:11791 length:1110 start_codon:yes stop_codon:yes gene_type:complete
MSFIETYEMKDSTAMLLFSERDEIQTDPDYQRMGGVWTLEKRQLLIDSIVNGYDLPKIYFHELSRETATKTGFRYAIIDGRQRLETIWQFMEDRFSLSSDIMYQRDPEIDLGGLRYSDIAKEHPRLRVKFDSFVLPVVIVRTEDDEIDLIEDMFSRLNEAVPLNAAEKRNAFGGDFVKAITEVSMHEFFTDRVRFGNKRYQHREVAARLMLTEHNVFSHGRLIDTKKVYLDQITHEFKKDSDGTVPELSQRVKDTLNLMCSEFHRNDELLMAQGVMVVYYLVFQRAASSGELQKVSRRSLIDFREELRRNRQRAEHDYTSSSFDYLEFDRLNQQGTNDASSIRERFRILANFLELREPENLHFSGREEF